MTDGVRIVQPAADGPVCFVCGDPAVVVLDDGRSGLRLQWCDRHRPPLVAYVYGGPSRGFSVNSSMAGPYDATIQMAGVPERFMVELWEQAQFFALDGVQSLVDKYGIHIHAADRTLVGFHVEECAQCQRLKSDQSVTGSPSEA